MAKIMRKSLGRTFNGSVLLDVDSSRGGTDLIRPRRESLRHEVLNWFAAETRQQRRQLTDHGFVGGAVRRHDAVQVFHLRRIVDERGSKEIRQAPATLAQYHFRRASVPLF